MKFTKNDLKTLLFVSLSSLFYAFAMKAFVEAGNFYPGGVAGLSRLISNALSTFFNIKISFSIFYMTMNGILAILVYEFVGKKFTIFSVVQFTLTSLFVDILPAFPLTDDLLLIAVFGGILGGFGVSIALRADASTGGTDFVAIYFSNKYHISTWNYVMGFNVCMLLVVGFIFSWEQALYSIIYQFCSTQVVQTLHNRYKLNTLFIVTKFPDEVSEAAFKTCRHGITRLNGEGAYSHSDVSLLIMTANAFQIEELCRSIKATDAKAFITINKTERIVGNYYQKPLE